MIETAPAAPEFPDLSDTNERCETPVRPVNALRVPDADTFPMISFFLFTLPALPLEVKMPIFLVSLFLFFLALLFLLWLLWQVLKKLVPFLLGCVVVLFGTSLALVGEGFHRLAVR